MENQAGWPDDQARTTVVSFPVEPAGRFFASTGFDRVVAIYPTLRAALTAPRASAEDTRSALCPAAR